MEAPKALVTSSIANALSPLFAILAIVAASAVIIGLSYFVLSSLAESEELLTEVQREDRERSTKAMSWLVGAGLIVGACYGIFFAFDYLTGGGEQVPVLVHYFREYELSADYTTQTFHIDVLEPPREATSLTSSPKGKQIYDCCLSEHRDEWGEENALMVQTGPTNKALPSLRIGKCLERKCRHAHKLVKFYNHQIVLNAKNYEEEGCVEEEAGHADENHVDLSVRWWGKKITANVRCPRQNFVHAFYKWMLDKKRVSGYAKWNTYIAKTDDVVTIYQPDKLHQLTEEDGLNDIFNTMQDYA